MWPAQDHFRDASRPHDQGWENLAFSSLNPPSLSQLVSGVRAARPTAQNKTQRVVEARASSCDHEQVSAVHFSVAQKNRTLDLRGEKKLFGI